MVSLGNDWDNALADEFSSDYYLALREFLKKEYSSEVIYPPMNDIYNALTCADTREEAILMAEDVLPLALDGEKLYSLPAPTPKEKIPTREDEEVIAITVEMYVEDSILKGYGVYEING
jgi:predicted RNase H-like HicB family nuclease